MHSRYGGEGGNANCWTGPLVYWYLKQSPNVKEYVGKKIRVVRLVEIKISKET